MRHLHETCDNSLHCEMKSECRGNGPKRTCQCRTRRDRWVVYERYLSMKYGEKI